MNTEARVAASYISAHLENLLSFSAEDTATLVKTNDIPAVAKHFVELRDAVKDLKAKLTLIQNHVDAISEEMIPTMFLNNGKLTSVRISGVGTVKVSERWSASPVPGNKSTAMLWLKNSNMEGIITETVNAQTLGAIAKDAQIAGKPLPSDLFKVSSSSFTSVTK